MNFAAHAWQLSIHVWLLGRSGCSSPSTKELHGWSDLMTCILNSFRLAKIRCTTKWGPIFRIFLALSFTSIRSLSSKWEFFLFPALRCIKSFFTTELNCWKHKKLFYDQTNGPYNSSSMPVGRSGLQDFLQNQLRLRLLLYLIKRYLG